MAPLRVCWPRTKGFNLFLWSTLGLLPKDLAKRVWVGQTLIYLISSPTKPKYHLLYAAFLDFR